MQNFLKSDIKITTSYSTYVTRILTQEYPYIIIVINIDN